MIQCVLFQLTSEASLEGKYSSLRDYWRSRTHDGAREATGKHLYDAVSIFNGVGAFEPATAAGKLWAAGYSFVVLLIIASYTANLTSFLVREQERVQIVTKNSISKIKIARVSHVIIWVRARPLN